VNQELHFQAIAFGKLGVVNGNKPDDYPTIESHNHRVAEVGRHLRRSSDPTPLLKQGVLEPVTQNHAQKAFECRQGGRLHNLLGQSVPVLSHHHSDVWTR